MKASVVLFVILLLSSAAMAQGRPIPPGIRQADQAVAQGEKDVPPPTNQRTSVDAAKLRRDADELATLAQSVPPAVDQTTKGMLPKDLAERLKKIEKLAKQLRSQISP
jgi:hypothetical protein